MAAQQRVGRVIEAWRANPQSGFNEKDGSRAPSTALTKSQRKERRANHTSFIQQTRVLTVRTWTVTIRDPMVFLRPLAWQLSQDGSSYSSTAHSLAYDPDKEHCTTQLRSKAT
ncbi:ATP-binding cassette sub-family G member 8 [Pyrenophora tritici-repentis Pt-1C-BFP]|uniref:ATP-binding cassette sub-family G member 8 n=1 Tax=Pyrenophora tritici-repentis (strain Pt-1C-BFP) TaxID=426418 RepID=B2VU81_PYRTR|nr:ATP-binding cassette sub-family G member 8 [Pyrenophora tritici-repentis Pt-1C-BFP]EDU41492.1 ATP-binding cassette sub-family G member 8 [Pyrenophora tritici-repentis Pt-1C-BFP]